MISLRPSLITEHHSVSSLNDPAREASPCSRYLRPARDVDTTCTVGRNVHESMATKVRAHRAPNLLRGCSVDPTDAQRSGVQANSACRARVSPGISPARNSVTAVPGSRSPRTPRSAGRGWKSRSMDASGLASWSRRTSPGRQKPKPRGAHVCDCVQIPRVVGRRFVARLWEGDGGSRHCGPCLVIGVIAFWVWRSGYRPGRASRRA